VQAGGDAVRIRQEYTVVVDEVDGQEIDALLGGAVAI